MATTEYWKVNSRAVTRQYTFWGLLNNYVQAKQGVSPLMGKIPWRFYNKQLDTKFPLEIICTKKDTVWSMTF